MDGKDIIKKAIEAYGTDAQLLMAIEEMSELTKAICKEKRARNTPNHKEVLDNVAEEIADVRIMLNQLCLIFNIDTSDIEQKKLLRLENRLNKN